ncbi:5201_t:CDS:2 [Ambispora gerdemannii]|uniref:5201_t:CDS:1 n=1 Tax=Ambispora gerdemannii TaxID=144530 RepID=A0A9N9CNJ8_9GLOM|nr:5201_t:CDS:2 [Ambispora gerdemannii]
MPARKQSPPPSSSGATSVNTATAINLATAAVSSYQDTTTTLSRQRRRRQESISSNQETTPTRKSPRNPSRGKTPVNTENMYSGESSDEDNDDYSSSPPKYIAYLQERRIDSPFIDVEDDIKSDDFSREEEKFRELQNEDSYIAEREFLKNSSESQEPPDEESNSEIQESDSPSPSVTRIPLGNPSRKSRGIDTTFPLIPPISKKRSLTGVNPDADGPPFYAPIFNLLKASLGFILWPLSKLLNLIGFSVFFLIALIQQTILFVWRNLTGHGQFVRILDTSSSDASPPVVAPSLVVATSTARNGRRYWWILWMLLLLWLLWNVRFGSEDKTTIEYIREFPVRDKLRFWPFNDPKRRIPFSGSGNSDDSAKFDLLYIKRLIAEEVRTSCEGKAPTINSNGMIEPHLIQLQGYISSEVKNICASNAANLKNQLTDDLRKIKNDVGNDVASGINNVNSNINTMKSGVKNDINDIKSQLNDFQNTVNGDIKNLRNTVKTDINDVQTDIKSGVKNDIKNLRNEIKTDMNELKNGIKNEIKHEYKIDINLIKGGVNEDMKNMRKDIRNELGHDLDVFKHDLSDVQKEFRSEIKDEIRNQMRGDLKSELKTEVRNEVKNEISNEIKTQISRTKSVRVPSWKGGEDLLEMIRSESRKIVEEELLVFSQDKLNRPDFALHSGGAKIISRFTSKTYELWPEEWYKKLFAKVSGQGILRGKPPVTAISPETHVGHCWPFAGQEGQLAILLNRRVYVTAITYDHVSRHVTFDVASAPKDFEVWGIIDEGNGAQGTPRPQDPDEETVGEMFKEAEDYMESQEEECGFREDGQYVTHKSGNLPTSKPSALSEIDPRIENATSGELKLGSSPLHFFLGSYTYNINGLPVQTFEIPEHIRKENRPIRAIIMKVNSNWGKPGYTCLYRFRVHGDPVDKIVA